MKKRYSLLLFYGIQHKEKKVSRCKQLSLQANILIDGARYSIDQHQDGHFGRSKYRTKQVWALGQDCIILTELTRVGHFRTLTLTTTSVASLVSCYCFIIAAAVIVLALGHCFFVCVCSIFPLESSKPFRLDLTRAARNFSQEVFPDLGAEWDWRPWDPEKSPSERGWFTAKRTWHAEFLRSVYEAPVEKHHGICIQQCASHRGSWAKMRFATVTYQSN